MNYSFLNRAIPNKYFPNVLNFLKRPNLNARTCINPVKPLLYFAIFEGVVGQTLKGARKS